MQEIPTGFPAVAPARTAAAGWRLPHGGAASAFSLRWQWDPLRIAVFLLLVFSISRFHSYLGLSQLRPALVLAVVALAIAILNPRLVGIQWKDKWPTRVVIALAVLACVSVPFGISIGRAAVFIIDVYSRVIILSLLLMAVIRSARELHMFVWAYVISTGLLVYLAVFVFRLRHYDGYSRLGGLYTYDANDIGVVLLSGLALTLLAFQTSGRRGKIFCGVVILGVAAALAKSGSRGSFIGLLLFGAYLLFLLPKVSIGKKIVVVLASVTALAIAAPPGYWNQMRTIQNLEEDYNWDSPYGRRNLAKRAFAVMWQKPLTGVGINNYPMYEGVFSERARTLDTSRSGYRIKWSAVHNSYLQAGAEMGVPGFLLFGSLIVGGVVGMHRLRRRLPRSWMNGDPEERFLYQSTIFLPLAFVGFAGPAFFISFAYMAPVYVLAAYATGVYVAVDEKLGRSRSLEARSPRPVAAAPRGRRYRPSVAAFHQRG